MFGIPKKDQPKYKVLEPAPDIKPKFIRTREILSAAQWLTTQGLLKPNPERDHLRDQFLLRRGFQKVNVKKIQCVKLLGLGDPAVGKTCFWTKLSTGQYPTEYIPSNMDNYSDIVVFGDSLVNLEYWVSVYN